MYSMFYENSRVIERDDLNPKIVNVQISDNQYQLSKILVFMIVSTSKTTICKQFTKDFNPFDITIKVQK